MIKNLVYIFIYKAFDYCMIKYDVLEKFIYG